MNQLFLVVSHLGASSNSLCKAIACTETIHWMREGFVYKHPTDITAYLSAIRHKGVFLNEILYNYQIAHKGVYQAANFIYLIRDPASAIQINKAKDAALAVNYYVFRLRRIYEMAKETKNAIFLSWYDLTDRDGFALINTRLQIYGRFEPIVEKKLLGLPSNYLREANQAYNLCLSRMRKIKHLVQL